MNSKNIKKHLNAKLKDWVSSIDDEAVRRVIEENTIITGGALVSLLQGEPVHDYDVYFRTKDAVITVAKYYVDKWNGNHDRKVSLLWGKHWKVQPVWMKAELGCLPGLQESRKKILNNPIL